LEQAADNRYDPKRLKFDLDTSKVNAGITPGIVKAMLLTKFEAWRYEGEFRVMADLKEQEKDGHYYYYYADFGETLLLREVIIGVRCETSQQEVASWIGAIGHAIEMRKARLAFNDFKVLEQKMQPVILAGKTDQGT
jgi:hypothetical protein